MVTPLGIVFSTDEKTVVQADLKLLGSTVKSLVVEFDQEKFEELFSLSPVSPKVSSETHFQVYSEFSHREPHTLFDKTSGSTSFEILTTSRGVNMACDNVFQETRKADVLVHDQHNSCLLYTSPSPRDS